MTRQDVKRVGEKIKRSDGLSSLDRFLKKPIGEEKGNPFDKSTKTMRSPNRIERPEVERETKKLKLFEDEEGKEDQRKEESKKSVIEGDVIMNKLQEILLEIRQNKMEVENKFTEMQGVLQEEKREREKNNRELEKWKESMEEKVDQKLKQIEKRLLGLEEKKMIVENKGQGKGDQTESTGVKGKSENEELQRMRNSSPCMLWGLPFFAQK